jgi:FkbM family methyltransferase
MTNGKRFLADTALALSRFAMRTSRRLGYYATRDQVYAIRQEHLRRMLSRLRINCVLDVGAHQGDFAVGLREDGYEGDIISFEPVAENFHALERRRGSDSRWRVHRLALGSQRGSADIRVFQGSTFHSLLDASDYGRERFPGRLEVQRTEAVPIERLEDILDGLIAHVEDPRIFLKIDTQGYDMEVIRGLGSAAPRIAALQMEMTARPLYSDATNSLVTALDELGERGFRLSGILPVCYESDGLSLVEFDCLMVGTRALVPPTG